MTASKQPKKSDSTFDGYWDEQFQYLQQLKDKLQEFRDSFGASMTDLANGLHISRQKLYDFMDKEDETLPIDRRNILSLWSKLTNFEDAKNLKPEEKQRRLELKHQGPDQLLITAGFLPRSGLSSPSTVVENPQIRRVASRLSSNWIEDDVLRASIANSILDQILEQGRLDKDYYIEPISGRNAENWLEAEFLRNSRLDIHEINALKKYKTEIRKLGSSGKTQFVKAELYELYQSILEHELIDLDNKGRLTVTDCQFRTVSIPTSNSPFYGSEENSDLCEVCKNAEVNLASLLDGSNKIEPSSESYKREDPFIPVIEVTISCSFYIGDHWECTKFRYASTATHIENMIIAIENGLSYPLEITGFFIRAIGRSAKSLARVSISLSEDQRAKEVYQGWWVTSNTILGISKAIVDALRKWISAKAIDSSIYYYAYYKLAEYDANLNDHIDFLFEQEPYRKNDSSHSQFLMDLSRIEKELLNVNSEEREELQKFSRILKVKFDTAKVMKLHGLLLECSLTEAQKLVRDIEKIIISAEKKLKEARISESGKETNEENTKKAISALKIDDAHYQLLSLYAASCLMLYKFLSGDRAFTIGKQWRLDNLYKIDNRLDSVKLYAKYIGAIDSSMYLYTSQLYGITAYLEFYSDSKDGLDNAVTYFLTASYYSSRIGYPQRAAYWIAYASRTCRRLNQLDKAKRLLSIAQQFLRQRNLSYNVEVDKDKDWSAANIYLAEGELLLANGNGTEQDKNAALCRFFYALNTAINTGLRRLVADSIYDTYLALKERKSIHINDEDFKNISQILDEKLAASNEWMLEREIFLLFKDLFSSSESAQFQEFATKFKDLAKHIWHSWATCVIGGKDSSETHPIVDEIEADRLLS